MSTPIPIYLAVEDELSEYALRRILAPSRTFHIATVYGKSGYGYLKNAGLERALGQLERDWYRKSP